MDYKDTLNLPKTDFQMKAELSKKEPEMLKRWVKEGLYEKMLAKAKTMESYTLHDGPPYANGHIHIGHALNKILKDITIKSNFLSGRGSNYVPGWDCHGLPIELQVEKNLGDKKDEMTKADIRRRCRKYAEKFVDIQREEFKRLGIVGRWDEPYLTMNYKYQASVMRELGRVHEEGLIYKGKKPVHWCASCQTALAEAEVEHADKTSPAVFVKFKVSEGKGKLSGKDAFIVIWTTTPWTLPANLAIAVHADVTYKLVKTPIGTLVIAEDLVESCMERFNVTEFSIGDSVKGSEIEGTVCAHPFIDRTSTVYTADFVTTEAGTGCVHIAPGHGHDDYQLGLKHGLDVYAPVDNKGLFTKDFPEFEGKFVFKANKDIIELLKDKDALAGSYEFEHSYPHCWRCKRAVIFRATSQWFVAMDEGGLRKNALKAIDDVKWIPSWGRDRMYSMIESRPDWCLSRQRAWGVPIPALTCKSCNESFLSVELIEKLANDFEEEGADIWFERELKDLLPEGLNCGCGGSEFIKEEDILDVWFDSGISFSAVLEKEEELKEKADLYLEGSDQHRGWFHSSLLASVATRKSAPYDAVLTHGFVVDGKGKKMSKSTGNVISPDDVIKKYGAEVLRLWVASEDYRDDIRISDEILKRLSEAYRRIRNTLRYILGNLSDFDPAKDMVAYSELTELDRLTLSKLSALNERVRTAYDEFEFHVIYHSVHNFCSVDLSSFYLDILKDRLYTAKKDSNSRRAAQTTIYHILDHLVRLLSPVLVFTTEEAWDFMPDRDAESVHLSGFLEPDKEWQDKELDEKWAKIHDLKTDISRAIELSRKDKVIGHSLDARVSIEVPSELSAFVEEVVSTLKEILIVSSVEITSGLDDKYAESSVMEGLKVKVTKAEGEKCERCWKIEPSVGENKEHTTICGSCVEAIS